MPKIMNNHYGFCQVFHAADGAGGGSGAGEGEEDGDDQDEDDSDEDGEDADEKKFSQKDMDEAVRKRIARERRKWQRESQKKGTGKDDSKGAGEDGSEESEDTKARKEAEAKTSKLEMKVACYEAGVAKDSVEDVAALARSYMDNDEDLDLEDAIEKVVKKYPQFKSGNNHEEDDDKKAGSWGQRQTGKGSKKLSGVEAKFYELNPDLKE